MMTFAKQTSPYLRRRGNVTTMMLDVIIALLPTLAFALVVYQLDALFPLLISCATMVFAEFVFVGITNMMKYDGKKHTFFERFKYAYKNYTINNFLTPLVSAIIFTLVLPASMPLYGFFVGALVGIILGKLVFGGLGSNIFNPAAVGMVFAKTCFGGGLFYESNWYVFIPDTATGDTPLTHIVNKGLTHMYDYDLMDMFLGKMPGTLGEAFTVTILIGAIYLVIKRAADFRIMLTYLGASLLMFVCAGALFQAQDPSVDMWYFTGYQMLSGGLFFGAIFMLTDPVTSPTNKPGRIIYAIIAAVVTVFIRFFASAPEGVGFSILIANMFVPVIEYYKWSQPKYNWKNITWMVSIFVVAFIILMIALAYGGGSY